MIPQRFGRMVLLVVAFGAFGCVGSLQAGAQSARDIDLQVNLYGSSGFLVGDFERKSEFGQSHGEDLESEIVLVA